MEANNPSDQLLGQVQLVQSMLQQRPNTMALPVGIYEGEKIKKNEIVLKI